MESIGEPPGNIDTNVELYFEEIFPVLLFRVVNGILAGEEDSKIWNKFTTDYNFIFKNITFKNKVSAEELRNEIIGRMGWNSSNSTRDSQLIN